MAEQELDAAVAPVGNDGGATGGSSRQSAQKLDPSQVDWSSAKFNPDEVPAFRELKSTLQRQVDEQRRMVEQANQRAAQVEQQYHEQRMRDMTEAEQVVYRAQLAEQRVAAKEAELSKREMAIYRERALDELAAESGVPRQLLQGVEEPLEAAKVIAKWAREGGRAQQQAQAAEESRQAHQVDIGGGSPMPHASDLQRAYDQARKEYDAFAQMDIMAEARKQGVKLKL